MLYSDGSTSSHRSRGKVAEVWGWGAGRTTGGILESIQKESGCKATLKFYVTDIDRDCLMTQIDSSKIILWKNIFRQQSDKEEVLFSHVLCYPCTMSS